MEKGNAELPSPLIDKKTFPARFEITGIPQKFFSPAAFIQEVNAIDSKHGLYKKHSKQG